jgi:hypothetical protein
MPSPQALHLIPKAVALREYKQENTLETVVLHEPAFELAGREE